MIRIFARDGEGTREITWSADSEWTPQAQGSPRDRSTLGWLEAGLALLKVPTFGVDEDPATFEQAIDRAFAEIRNRGADQLDIDVRGSTGGQSDAGAHVVRNFLHKPVVQVASARERLNADNNGVLGYRGQPGDMVEFDLSDKAIEPVESDMRFSGPVAVLIDELTYSAGILFATAMQDYGLAGRPTGGFANQTGNMMPTRLPNTGFNGFIETREFVRPSGEIRDSPVVPDLPFAAELGRDDLLALMEKAGALLC